MSCGNIWPNRHTNAYSNYKGNVFLSIEQKFSKKIIKTVKFNIWAKEEAISVRGALL